MSAVEQVEVTEIVSPFLEGTRIQYAWDSTSLGYLKTCPRLYYYVIIEGWQPRGENVNLRFGIEYHKALEDYDKQRALGCDHDEALNSVVRELLIRTADFNPTEKEFGKAAKLKNRYSLMRAVIWYLDTYPAEKDTAKTHMLDGGRPAVELSFRFELDWAPQHDPNQPYILCGHLDRVVNYQGDLFTMDRKTTTSSLGSYYFDQFSPHNQMSLYTLGGKIVLNSPVKGTIIDACQVQVEGIEFKRGFTFRTEDQIQEWIDDLSHWLRLAEHYATMDYWPMNDTACDKFGGCAFRDICSKDSRVRGPHLKSNFNKLEPEERWNPLVPR